MANGATTEEMVGSIEPGSIPSGERQGLEQGLADLGSAAEGPPLAGPAAAAGGDLGIPSNPLDPLLGGDLPVGQQPVTSGLRVGPGASPFTEPIPDGRIERLRMMATTARSPVLRELARRSLRSMMREIDSA